MNTHHIQVFICILGTALKIVAGTPDFEDFEKLKFNQQRLIESIDRQTIINTRGYRNELTKYLKP